MERIKFFFIFYFYINSSSSYGLYATFMVLSISLVNLCCYWFIPDFLILQQILTPPDFFRGLKPLGLKLTITPSLVNQIERELSKRRNANLNSDAFKASPIKMEPGMDVKRVNLGNNDAGQSMYNKLKISNFSAHLLKIGSWKVLLLYPPLVSS